MTTIFIAKFPKDWMTCTNPPWRKHYSIVSAKCSIIKGDRLKTLKQTRYAHIWGPKNTYLPSSLSHSLLQSQLKLIIFTHKNKCSLCQSLMVSASIGVTQISTSDLGRALKRVSKLLLHSQTLDKVWFKCNMCMCMCSCVVMCCISYFQQKLK